MSPLKWSRLLTDIDAFCGCHLSKRLCSVRRKFPMMDGLTRGKSAAAKAAVLNHIKVYFQFSS